MSFASLLLVTAACGDDNQVGTDAQAPDAAKTFKGYDADEGGELRVEYVRRPDGTAFARVTSFLWKDPGSRDFTPFVNLNGCTDLRDKTKWPTYANPVGERVYMESGDVTIKGGSMDLVLPLRTTDFSDPFGRLHPANTGHHLGPPTITDAAMYLPPATALDVSYAGSADFPAQTFDDVIYMPQDFAVTNFTTGPVLISPATAAADMTFTFENPAQTPAEPDGRVMSLVAFLSPTTGPIVACIEPADGSITMPKELVAIAKAAGPSGTLARQTLSHVVRELKDKDGNTGRRIDFVGVWCYAYPFTFQ